MIKYLYQKFPWQTILGMTALTVGMIILCVNTYYKGQIFHTAAWVIITIDFITRIREYFLDWVKKL